MKELQKLLKRFIKEEKSAKGDYSHLVKVLRNVKAPREIINVVGKISKEENSHRKILEDILWAVS